MIPSSKPASSVIIEKNRAVRQQLPFEDTQDFEDARRGLVARRTPNAITNESGAVVWNNDTYDFITGDAPDTVNPSLWRQSQLVAEQGLFEVVEGIYQVPICSERPSPEEPRARSELASARPWQPGASR